MSTSRLITAVILFVACRTTAFAPSCHRSWPNTITFLSSTPQRKKKKNKYEQFSKVKRDTDPLQELMVESERKMAALQFEQQPQTTTIMTTTAAAPPPPPPKQFPDTAIIDPYDPRTFGYITLGTIQGAHGVQGWIKVRTSEATDSIVLQQRSFTQTGWIHIRLPNKRAPRPMLLLQGRQTTEQQYLVQLQDMTDREQAQTLRGATVFVRNEQLLPETTDDEKEEKEKEYDVSELVGMEVFLAENQDAYVGKVSGIVFCEDISSIPLGHDFLELLLPGTDSGMASYKDELVLIPFVPQLVPTVDVQRRHIHIDPPAGLLDLTYVRSDKVRVKGFLPASRTTMD
jgi:16S rRNA processing protein RimM